MADVAAAAAIGSVPAEDDEKYLYGEGTETIKENDNERVNGTTENENGVEKQEDMDADDGEFDESDDDDDDNIQVHIGEVNAANPGTYGTPVSWKKDAAAAAVAKAAALPTQGQKKIDVNTVGIINGQPIYEYDVDAEQDEKPWRKPGADISDYFNYGFTEDTWKQYCEKQRRMRLESNRGPYVVTTANPSSVTPANAQVEIEVLPDGRTRVKAGPPPDRRVEGSIHVLGSDDVRRKQKEEELLALALGQSHVITPQTFPGQRQMYTALPNGTVVYNQYAGNQMIQPPSSQGETSTSENSIVSSQGQQIQTLGTPAPSMLNSVLQPGLQYLPTGGQPIGGIQPIATAGPQIFPPPHNIGMDYPRVGDPFLHPGMPPPSFGQFGNSDDDFDSDGENRRHRSRRDSSRHRRHRDRSERDGRSERSERDRPSRRDRDRSESRSRRDHSKSSSDRKKHSSSRSSSAIKNEDGENGDRKSRSSRRSSKQTKDEEVAADKEGTQVAVKQEPAGD